MKKNMGSTDKIIRILIAAVFLVLYFTGVIGGLLGTILVILSIMLLLTSFISFCPLYPLLKINTTKKENN